MRTHRGWALALAVLVAAAACSSGSDGAERQNLAAAQAPDSSDPADGTDESSDDAESTADGAAEADPSIVLIEEADAAVSAVRDDCGGRDAVSNLQAEPLDRTTFVGPSLICADLQGIDLSDAVVGVAVTDAEATIEGAQRVVVDGANFAGANLRGATLSLSAVGASFAGADLTGADLTDSDLRGADFTGAVLTGSTMTSLAGGLTRANLSSSVLGCNSLTASPGMDFTGVIVDTDCGQSPQQWTNMSLDGNLDLAIMAGFDFSDVIVRSVSFRQANLGGANLSNKGVWPDGSDFTGAVLTAADLSGTGFFDADFSNADLTGAVLVSTYFRNTVADGAAFSEATLQEAWFQRVSLTAGSMANADLTGAILDRVDLSGTDFAGSFRDGLVLRQVVCPSGLETMQNVGSCDIQNGFEPAADGDLPVVTPLIDAAEGVTG